MKQSIYVLLASAVIIGMTVTSSATAQTKPASSGVVLTNAYDAFGKDIKGLKQDFGFSTVVEYGGKTVLFDAGTDARVFESNLKALKIDLRKVDIAIVSHGNYDHTGGFENL
jgi:7,8-dihydropterin-6-yl-methyl-4-(beta-D-ribofuranosyl)aminobenzene 5'-phosphate synthase